MITTAFSKAVDEWRYTLGPVYAPNTLDLHGEYADDDALHRAFLEFGASGDRRLRLQHQPDVEVGTIVELMRWPQEATFRLEAPRRKPYDVTLPAGTVYMGVIWDERPWVEFVKTGKVAGYSMGGRALRVVTDGAPGPPVKKSAGTIIIDQVLRHGYAWS